MSPSDGPRTVQRDVVLRKEGEAAALVGRRVLALLDAVVDHRRDAEHHQHQKSGTQEQGCTGAEPSDRNRGNQGKPGATEKHHAGKLQCRGLRTEEELMLYIIVYNCIKCKVSL